MFRLVSMTNASGLSEAGQMAAPDLPIFFTNRLHLAGRPQMSTRPSGAPSSASGRTHPHEQS